MKHDVSLIDRRSRKSQKALQQGLISLLQRIPFEEVTIQAITDEADTARVTFYRHYGSKEELLLDVIKDFHETLREYETSISLSFDDLLNFNNVPPTFLGYSIINNNRLLAKNIFTSPVQNFLRKVSHQIVVDRITAALENSPHYADLPAQFIANHVAIATTGYLFWWVTEDFPCSVERIARLTHYMSLCGALKMIGRDDLITLPSPNIWDVSANGQGC